MWTSKKEVLRLQLQDAIYSPDSFVLMLRYCANLKAIRYESTSLKRIVADKSVMIGCCMTKILLETLRLAIERETTNHNLQVRTTNFSLFLCTSSLPLPVYIKYLSLCLLPSLSLITNLETTFKHYRLAINHDWLDQGLTHHIGQLSRMTLLIIRRWKGYMCVRKVFVLTHMYWQ